MAGFGRGAEAAELILDENEFALERLRALEDQERRSQLDQITSMGAAIEIELGDRGPLYHYLQARRAAACEAMMSLVTLDPRDGVAIAAAQAGVVEYLQVTRWIKQRREDAAEADASIKEDYGQPHDHQATHQD